MTSYFGMKAVVDENGICRFENGEAYNLKEYIGKDDDNDPPEDKEAAQAP